MLVDARSDLPVHHPSPGSPLPSHTAFSDKDLVHQTSLSSLTAPSTSFYSAPSSTVREHDSPRGSPSGSMHEGYDSHRARTDEDKRRSRDLRDFRHGQEYGDGSTDRKSGEGAGKLAGEPDGQQKRRPSVLLELPVERRGGEVMEEKTTKQEPKRYVVGLFARCACRTSACSARLTDCLHILSACTLTGNRRC